MEDERKPPAKDNKNDNNEPKKRRARKVPKRQRNPNLRGRRRDESASPANRPVPSIKSSLSMESISEDEALPDVKMSERSREVGRWDSSGASSGTDSETERPNLQNMARTARAASSTAAKKADDNAPKVPRRRAARNTEITTPGGTGSILPNVRIAPPSAEDRSIAQKSERAQANSAQQLKKPPRRGSGNAADASPTAQAPATAVAVAPAAAMQSFATPQNQSQRPPMRRNSVPGSGAEGNQKAKKGSKTKTKPKRKSF